MESLPVLFTAFFILALAQLGLLAYLWWLDRRFGEVRERQLGRVGEKGWDVLHSAIKKSQAMVGQAELESLEQRAKSDLEIKKFEEKYQEEIQLTASEVQQAFLSEVAKASGVFKDYLGELKKTSEDESKALREEMAARVAKVSAAVEEQVKFELKTVEERSVLAMEAEVGAMRTAVEEYRKKRLEQIDRDIVEVVEKVAKEYLRREIPVKNQMELVYESLERAKEEKFF